MKDEKHSDRSFAGIRGQILIACESGDFQRALSLIEQFSALFPEKGDTFAIWRVSVLAVSNHSFEAVQALENAIEKGFWWPVSALRGEPDLASLQGEPRFEACVQICDRRARLAQQAARPERRVLLPETKPNSAGYPLLVILHGRGGKVDDFIDLWQPALQYGWIVAMLGSSQASGYGSLSWDNRELARNEIEQQVLNLQKDYPVDAQRVVIAGFSQGAGLAFEMAVRSAIPFRGFFAVSPSLVELKNVESSTRAVSPRGVITAGELDARWAVLAQQIADWMAVNGFAFQLRMYPELAHDFPPDFTERFPAWLKWLTDLIL